MAENASKVAQIRGNEGISKRKIETLQEELKRWTMHKVSHTCVPAIDVVASKRLCLL